MTYTIDTTTGELCARTDGHEQRTSLYSKEGFELLSRLWLQVCWNQKYTYTFTWLGRPVIQLPEDLIRIQEVIHTIRPDVILETGVAHGGSLIFYASLCVAMGHGRVVGVDVEIRPHNRRAIEEHPLSPTISLIEGGSTDPAVLDQVRKVVGPTDTVLVILDSNHSRAHVRAELEAYSRFVSIGSYIVATDGIMQDVADVPRGRPEWCWDNPVSAVREFLEAHPEFECQQPAWLFNESDLDQNLTHWPQAYLRRTR